MLLIKIVGFCDKAIKYGLFTFVITVYFIVVLKINTDKFRVKMHTVRRIRGAPDPDPAGYPVNFVDPVRIRIRPDPEWGWYKMRKCESKQV